MLNPQLCNSLCFPVLPLSPQAASVPEARSSVRKALSEKVPVVRKEEALEHNIFQKNQCYDYIYKDECWDKPEVLVKVVDECEFQCGKDSYYNTNDDSTKQK